MKIVVDLNKCQYHGQCTISAPEIFELVGERELHYVADPDESLRVDAEEAMDACPTQAITIQD